MLANERGAFAKLVETLLAGFNVPATEARIDAYWRGCNGMHLLAFERTVDYVLGPDGEDDLPTPRQMHFQHRCMLAARRAETASLAPSAPEPIYDIFDTYSNRVLLTYLRLKANRTGSGPNPASFADLLACKKRYAAGYREMCITEPEASLELRDALFDAFEALYVPLDPEAAARVQRSDDCWHHVAA